MTSNSARKLFLLTAFAAAFVPATAAQAQYYGSAYAQQPPPLYPYAVQRNQPYAIEVAPGTYVIQRPGAAQPSQRSTTVRKPVPEAVGSDRPRKPVDHALIDELRQRAKSKTAAAKTVDAKTGDSDETAAPAKGKHKVINTTKIVRYKPVVIETTRVVDDPPRVVERYQVVEGAPPPRTARERPEPNNPPKRAGRDEKRVIRAEAEITILGPDRMSIRLFRKGDKSNASAD